MFFQIQKYSNERTVEAMSSFIDKILESYDNEHSVKTESQKNNAQENIEFFPGKVVELTQDSFQSYLSKPGIKFIKFFAPWCS